MSTSGYMPIMECPACGAEWPWDDYYDVATGDERNCPACDVQVVVDDVEYLIYCRLRVAKGATK
jgi:endogenous inhibitor of DNA gyrase (YacG/DUF329 family)